MRFRTVIIAAALASGLVATSNAFVPHKGSELLATPSRQPRAHRTTSWLPPQHASVTPALASWKAIWDRDTDVPLRMWGKSIAAPNTIADAAAAEAAARSFLAANLATLAPGAQTSDFVLVANKLDPNGHIRTLGFAQESHGLRVLGAGIGVVFERDHLVMVSSTALPDISVRMPIGPLQANVAATSASTWMHQDGVVVKVEAEHGRVIVPVIHERGTKAHTDIEYRVAESVTVSAVRGEGRWNVWVDAGDAAPIARESTVHYTSGVLAFDVPDRWPGGNRSPHPAANVTSTVDGAQVQSDLSGNVTWAGAGTITPGLTGPYVKINNVAGSIVQEQMSLVSGGTLTWSKATDGPSDAQLDSFVFASDAKHFALTRLNPNADAVTWLGGQIPVFVNENDTCNAYSNGDDIHFFIADANCENTGRIADVVYHEFGHSLHANSIIQGVGAFDSSLSEGLADTLAVSITGDPGMGRGFFFTDQALRDVNPTVKKKWPQDADGEPHDEGEIIGEALYDTRLNLQAGLGTSAGFEQFLTIYYGVMQRASDIPSSYAAALLADDNNGDLSDGTPNQCAIDAAFGMHGLSDPVSALGLKPPTRDGFNIQIKVNAPSSSGACPPPTVTNAKLTWKVHGGTAADIDLAVGGDGQTYSATIPTQPEGSIVEYHVTVTLSDGNAISYPDNLADPDYQMYVGNAQIIKCFDFEDGFGDWTHSSNPVNRDDWEAGTPAGLGGDPTGAHGGTGALGTDLGTAGTDNGLYRSRTKEWVISPAIDLAGQTANVHLQYYRWLNIEDGAYDQATIFANDGAVWSNLASPGMPTAEVNHTDKEWRFHDVDLSAAAASGNVTLKFELDSDAGLSLGGWTIDDVCVVVEANVSLCGNGTVDPGESCDDGNTTGGDGCSATCAIEACPDSGGTGPCEGGGGCCSSTKDPSGPIVLTGLVLGALIVRRRRRR